MEELLVQTFAKQARHGPLVSNADELFNRIREKFDIGRMIRLDGPSGGYSHNATTVAGVLFLSKETNDAAARDIAMHIAAMRPAALSSSELDPETVANERKVLRDLH